LKKLIDKALSLLNRKSGKGGDTEAVTVPSVRVGKEQTKAYIIGRWGGLRDGGFVNEFKYRKDEDYEHEGERGGDLIAVELHCLNWENHCKQSAFIGALTSRNPGMFHDIILHTPDESLHHPDNPIGGWEDTWVTFRGKSGAGFHVDCYKIRRGHFDIVMVAGKYDGDTFITEQNFKELVAVIEAFEHVESLTPEEVTRYHSCKAFKVEFE
jgi:hypothetical protein